jgi:hypothetical protein
MFGLGKWNHVVFNYSKMPIQKFVCYFVLLGIFEGLQFKFGTFLNRLCIFIFINIFLFDILNIITI